MRERVMVDAEELKGQLLIDLMWLKESEPVIAGHSVLEYNHVLRCVTRTIDKAKKWEVDTDE